jgi:hypothetical protein
MAKTVVNKHAAQGPDIDNITLPFGTLVFSGKDGQRISKISYNPGEPAHIHYPLKAKHQPR